MAPRANRGGASRATTWERFAASHRDVLDEWLHAEVTVARALDSGLHHSAAGDRLLAAEAALQGAIIDFAAEVGNADPTRMAVELLRHAETHLAHALDGAPRTPA